MMSRLSADQLATVQSSRFVREVETTVPEPSTAILLLAGLAGVARSRRGLHSV